MREGGGIPVDCAQFFLVSSEFMKFIMLVIKTQKSGN